MKKSVREITVAKSAGFCFGVDRAVKLVYKLVEEGKQVCTLGPIIHNTQVVDDLKSKGVIIIEDPSEAPPNSCVVIRSHGVSQDVYDSLKENKQEYLDATCPFVAKIHDLVAQAGKKNVLIAGNPNHPEIIGIRSRCKGESFVFETLQELQNLFSKKPDIKNSPGILVAQTTFRRELWKKISDFAKKTCTSLAIFDTICYATCERQSEAANLAQKSDLMIVVGDKHSSNTAKLKKVCEGYTETVFIEKAEDLDLAKYSLKNKIGITAGASTPAYIIKEVHEIMNKMIENPSEELSFAELLEQSDQENQRVFPGKRIQGTVVSVAGEEVQVDIGGKQSGIIPLSEWSLDANSKPSQQAHPGDVLQLIVVKASEQDGLVTLSKKRMDAQKDYEDIIKAMDEETTLSGVVEKAVKGGVLVEYKDMSVFVPLSHLSTRRIENPEEMVGQQVEFKVIEVNARQKRVVGSIRKALREIQKEKEKQLWETIEVGKHYTGVVRSMTSYGAFVDIGGVDGMIHVSDLSWVKIKHPSEVVKVGDSVEVYVKDLDPERRRISLGYKKMEDNPWVVFENEHHIGEIIKGKVVSLPAFGAFVEIASGIDGLIHISRLADKRVEKPSDILSLGEEVEAEIVSMNAQAQRIGLSVRSLIEKEKEKKEQEQRAAVEQIEGVHLLQEGEQIPDDKEDLPAQEEPVSEVKEAPATEAAVVEEVAPVEEAAPEKEEAEEKPKKAKTTTKKATAKKATAKKTTTKKETAKKETAKKTTAKKETAKKTTAKKETTKKSADKKETTKKETAKKTTAKKETAKKPAAKKTTTKKTATKKPAAKKTTKKKAEVTEEVKTGEKE